MTPVYNFSRVHQTIKTTPAIRAGVTDQVMSPEDMAGMIEAAEPKPRRPKRYRKRG